MAFRILLKIGIASVVDRHGEVCTIALLKGEDCRLQVRANGLQLKHPPSLFRSGVQSAVSPNTGRVSRSTRSRPPDLNADHDVRLCRSPNAVARMTGNGTRVSKRPEARMDLSKILRRRRN